MGTKLKLAMTDRFESTVNRTAKMFSNNCIIVVDYELATVIILELHSSQVGVYSRP